MAINIVNKLVSFVKVAAKAVFAVFATVVDIVVGAIIMFLMIPYIAALKVINAVIDLFEYFFRSKKEAYTFEASESPDFNNTKIYDILKERQEEARNKARSFDPNQDADKPARKSKTLRKRANKGK